MVASGQSHPLIEAFGYRFAGAEDFTFIQITTKVVGTEVKSDKVVSWITSQLPFYSQIIILLIIRFL